jgi:hypothetical protein
MIVPKIRRCAFLLVALLGLQQSCRTTPVVPTQGQPPEPEKAETKDKGDNEAVGLLPKGEQQSSKNLQFSLEPLPSKRLPESIVSAPEKELASPGISYDTTLVGRASDARIHAGWQYRKNRQNQIVGFEFSNRGGNPILPQRYDIAKNLLFTRDFQFRFDDRARQDIHLFISDWVASQDRQFRLSELMNSVMHFFPRNYLPSILGSSERYIVTLPTGEQVEFDATTREVRGGVFTETSVDFNPDRKARKFPGIHYLGKGVLVRADVRGKDPRIKNIATITTGTPPPDCEKGAACDRCQVPSHELWHQNGAIRFKFSTDKEFERYLLVRCGFGIPQYGNDDHIAALPHA